MTDLERSYLDAVETHAPDRIRAAFDAGLDPRRPIRGKAPFEWLTEMYTRSERFAACVRALVERGAGPDDDALVSVLLDDADAVRAAVAADPALLARRTTLVSAFTPLAGVPLLHVAVEYGSLRVARALLVSGADVNARAETDRDGFGGHTALFHVVCSRHPLADATLERLLEAGARPDVRVDGLVWGRGFEWETTFFDLTPISYAQLGLLPQMQRGEREVYETIRTLLQAAARPVPSFANVPNRYRNAGRGA